MVKIKALVMDVDGTLTDGGIYMGNHGEVMKRFDVKDGYAIRHILPEQGIIPIVITGRQSDIVKMRCEELGIKELVQGSQDKTADMLQILEKLDISAENTAYIGDDLNDLECMKLAGYKACPADAVDEVQVVCDYVSNKKGGEGAVRDIVEHMRSD